MTTKQIDSVTLTMIDEAIAQTTPFRHALGPTHPEFLAWAAEQGLDQRLIDFLTQQGDCAGTSPAAWTRLDAIGRSDWYKRLPGDERQRITIWTIGEEAFAVYLAWARKNPAEQG